MEDYNINLPDNVQEKLQHSDSDKAANEIEEEDENHTAIKKLNKLFESMKTGKRTGFLPGINEKDSSSPGNLKLNKLKSVINRNADQLLRMSEQ